MRNSGIIEKSDGRILGSGEFVTEVIQRAEEKLKYLLSAYHASIRQSLPPLPKLRRVIVLKLVNEYGLSLAETARRLGISTSGVAQIFRRSEGV